MTFFYLMHSQMSVSQTDWSILQLRYSLLPCSENQPSSSFPCPPLRSFTSVSFLCLLRSIFKTVKATRGSRLRTSDALRSHKKRMSAFCREADNLSFFLGQQFYKTCFNTPRQLLGSTNLWEGNAVTKNIFANMTGLFFLFFFLN